MNDQPGSGAPDPAPEPAGQPISEAPTLATDPPAGTAAAGSQAAPQGEPAAAASGSQAVPPGQPAGTSSAPPARSHQHRWLVGVLFVLATLIGTVAVLAVWANRQALNTDNWTNTSSRLLENPEIQKAVAAYAVNQLFSSGVPQAEIKAVLPTQLQALAGPVSGGLQQLAGQIAPRVLATSQVQAAWRQANRSAHQVLLKIINGGGSVASTNGGVVTLNLHAVVDQIASALGAESQVAAVRSKVAGNAGAIQGAATQAGIPLPPATGQLVILRSSQLKTVQDIASDIKGLAVILPIITFALFILAVWLSIGRRREALRRVGWCFVGIGLLVLVVRRIGGNAVINGLVKNPANKPAGHEVWTIGTSLLYDIAVALVIYGLILVAVAWVAGGTRPARALRRMLAPTLRERPAAAYAAAFGVLLIVIVWGPTPATRQIAYIILFVVLLVLAIEALRRQTAREYPPDPTLVAPGSGGGP
jgi:hypothetical protein